MYNFLVCKTNINSINTNIKSADELIMSSGKVIGLQYEPKVSTIADIYRNNYHLANNETLVIVPLVNSNVLKTQVIESTLTKPFGYNELLRFKDFFSEGVIIDSMIDESSIDNILPSWSKKVASRKLVYTNFV